MRELALDTPQMQREHQKQPRIPGRLKFLLTILVAALLLFVLLVRLLIATNHATAPSARMGTPAPTFTITTWNPPHQSLRLSALYGQPVVVNFWQSSCIPCQSEAQMLEQQYVKYAPYGVTFVGVAFNTTQSDGLAYLKKYGITYPNGPDLTGATASAYGLAGTPETVFINSQGVEVREIIGEAQPSLVAYYITHDLLA